MKDETKTENRGGKRAGAGRKPKDANKSAAQVLTEKQISDMLAAAKKVEKETSVSIDEVLVRLIYSAKSKTSEKLAAIKLFKEYTMIKTTESNVNVSKHVGPQIGLPELKPLPENVVSINKDMDG